MRVPVQMIHGAILQIKKPFASLAEKNLELSAQADNSVGVAILTYRGRSELQHKRTHQKFIHRTNMQTISLI